MNRRVVDTARLEREVRAKIERHVADLQALLEATAGDTAHTRRLLEERADLTKSYSEALFDGCIKAVAVRINNMQRSNHQHMVEQVHCRAALRGCLAALRGCLPAQPLAADAIQPLALTPSSFCAARPAPPLHSARS